MKYFVFVAAAALIGLSAGEAVAQSGETTIHVDRHRSVCRLYRDEISNAFDQAVQRLASGNPGYDYLALACAQHADGWTFHWATRASADLAASDALSMCAADAEQNSQDYGSISEACTIYGTAVRSSE